MRRAGSFGVSLALLAGFSATTAYACDPVAEVGYVESAPADFLTIANRSAGAWRLVEATIDLTQSVGAVVLDNGQGPPGAGAWREFRQVAGAPALGNTGAEDGSRRFSIVFEAMGPGTDARFELDLDDTLPTGSQRTRIAGREISGAEATARFIGPGEIEFTVSGVIGDDGAARLEPLACS